MLLYGKTWGDPTFMMLIYFIYVKHSFPYPVLVLVLFNALELVAFVAVNSCSDPIVTSELL